jgi:hypothetical protein
MINSPNNRLDEFVKKSLENYQVPFNEAHWNEFESKLNTQPSVNPFGKWNFSLNTIIGGVIVLSAAAIIYAMSGSRSPVKNTAVNSTTTITSEQKVKPENAAANTKPVTETKAPDQQTGTLQVDPFTFSVHTGSTYSFFTSSDLSGGETTGGPTDPTAKPNGFSFTSTTASNTTGTSGLNTGHDDGQLDPKELQDALKNSSSVVNNNIFPDQIDPLKGPVKNTKETDTIIKKANDIPEDNPLIQIGPHGEIQSNPEKVIEIIKGAENKSDSTNKAPQGPRD